MQTEEVIHKIYSFLDMIGIPFQETAIEGDTFLPGIRVEAGILEIDREQLKYPGDILHEAGHLALSEPARRAVLNQAYLDEAGVEKSEEIGVLLWTFLAAQHLDLPPEVVFHADGYKGSSQWLLDTFNGGTYIGLPLLKWMGMVEEMPGAGFPKVVKWLR